MNVKIENIQKSYFVNNGTEIKVLKGINLEIKSGETVAVVGPSGAGKSTLIHILGLMDRPTAGKIYLDGFEYTELDDSYYVKARQNKIGFLFQMHYLLPDFSVWENVLIPVWDKKSEKMNEAKALLQHLGLSHRLEHMPSELSGGEQQRAALARALINNPEFLMADEPTGNLDRETGEIVEKLIFSECQKRNITLVLVTHNPELAEKAGRIIKMRDGLLE